MQKTKSIILGLVTLGLQITVWLLLHRALTVSATTSTWTWLTLLAATMVSVSTFFFLTDKMRWFSELIIALSAISYFLISTKDQFVWIGGVLFVAFTFWYELRLHAEAVNRLDFSVTRVVGSSVSVMIYGLLLLLGFNIYYNVLTDFRNNPEMFYNRLGEQAAKSVPYFTKNLAEGANLNQPFSEYLEQQAQENPKYDEVGPFEKEILISEAKRSFENQFQITASEDQSLADIMAQVAVNKVRSAAAPFEKYLPAIFTIIIIGLLFTFTFLIRWAVILISWILFEILRLTGFFKFEKVVVEVKKLIV